MADKIPIFFIKKHATSNLQGKLQLCPEIFLIETVTENGIPKVAQYKKEYFDVMVVIDVDNFEKDVVVINSLFLRNANYQVFISTADDFSDLLEVVKDVHKFIQEAAKDPVRTEIIVTEIAMDILGDIKPIVELFERNFIGKHSKSNIIH